MIAVDNRFTHQFYKYDIVKATDELNNDDIRQGLYERLIKDSRSFYDGLSDKEFEDIFNEEVDKTDNLFKVNTNSAFYHLLREFLDDEPVNHARDGFIVGTWMYFRVGNAGYAIDDTPDFLMNCGLLNSIGRADSGFTRKRFDEFVASKEFVGRQSAIIER